MPVKKGSSSPNLGSNKTGSASPFDTRAKAMLILSVLGVLVSMYLVKDHYSTTHSICDMNSTISCSKINKSVFAKLFNVPVAVFGVCWFLTLAAFSYKVSENGKDIIVWSTAHFLWVSSGVLFVIYLIIAEMILRAICPMCTVIHVIVGVILYLSWTIFSEQKQVQRPPPILYLARFLQTWIIVIGILHLLPLIYFNFLEPPASPDRAAAPLYPSETMTNFAKCLSGPSGNEETSIVMFGSNDCPHCDRQKKLFADSFKYINYIDCIDNELVCLKYNVKQLPTWMKVTGLKTPTINRNSGANIGNDNAVTGGLMTEVERKIGVLTLQELAQFSQVCTI